MNEWHSLSKAARDAAIDWHIRLSAGDASDDDYDVFAEWVAAAPDNSAAYACVEMMGERIDRLRSINSDAFDELLPRLGAAKAEPANDNWLSRRSAIAASLTGLVLVSAAIFRLGQSGSSNESIALTAPVDQFRTAKLSDGSTIYLSPGASFAGTFNNGARNVTSLSGVAYFEVESDSDRPFTIALEKNMITVVGTEFEVAAFSDRQSITVSEGIVAVRSNTSQQPQSEQRLIAGDQMSISDGSFGVVVRDLFPREIGAWRVGYFEFEEAGADAIAARLNSFYGRKIYAIDADNPPVLSFSGIITLSDPAGTARRLGELTQLNIAPTEEGYLLSGK